MKTRHTPGPWKLVKGKYYQTIRVENHVIADMRIIGGHTPYNLHDAALIAAAPELLEALTELVCAPVFTGTLFETDHESHRAWTLARAAIQKARGEQ